MYNARASRVLSFRNLFYQTDLLMIAFLKVLVIYGLLFCLTVFFFVVVALHRLYEHDYFKIAIVSLYLNSMV